MLVRTSKIDLEMYLMKVQVFLGKFVGVMTDVSSSG